MKNLPNFVKWLIVIAALALMGAMVWAVNDRASRVKMPEPDTSFGFYHVTPEEAGRAPAAGEEAESKEEA